MPDPLSEARALLPGIQALFEIGELGNVEDNPEIVQDILRDSGMSSARARALSMMVTSQAMDRRIAETKATIESLPPQMQEMMMVDWETGGGKLAPGATKEDLFGMSELLSEIEAEQARFDRTGGNAARAMLGGAIRGFQNFTDFGGFNEFATGLFGLDDEYRKFRMQQEIVQANEPIASSIGHLAPFMVGAAAGGQLLRGTAGAVGGTTRMGQLMTSALGSDIGALAIGGGLSADPGHRPGGAIFGGLAGVAGRVGHHVTGSISRRLLGGDTLTRRMAASLATRFPPNMLIESGGKFVNRSLQARLGRVALAKILPEAQTFAGEFVGFGALGIGQEAIRGLTREEWEPEFQGASPSFLLDLMIANAAVIATMKGVSLAKTISPVHLPKKLGEVYGVKRVVGQRGDEAHMASVGRIRAFAQELGTLPRGEAFELRAGELTKDRILTEGEAEVAMGLADATARGGPTPTPLGLPSGLPEPAIELGPPKRKLLGAGQKRIESGLSPSEEAVIVELGKWGIPVSAEKAAELVENPRLVWEILANKAPHALPNESYAAHVARLKALEQMGLLQNVRPVEELGIATGHVRTPEVDMAIEQLGDIGLAAGTSPRGWQARQMIDQLRDVNNRGSVAYGTREVLLKEMQRLGKEAQSFALRGKHREAQRVLEEIEGLKEVLRDARTVEDYQLETAARMRQLAEQLDPTDPSAQVLLAQAGAIEMRAGRVDPPLEAAVAGSKNIESRLRQHARAIDETIARLEQGKVRGEEERARILQLEERLADMNAKIDNYEDAYRLLTQAKDIDTKIAALGRIQAQEETLLQNLIGLQRAAEKAEGVPAKAIERPAAPDKAAGQEINVTRTKDGAKHRFDTDHPKVGAHHVEAIRSADGKSWDIFLVASASNRALTGPKMDTPLGGPTLSTARNLKQVEVIAKNLFARVINPKLAPGVKPAPRETTPPETASRASKYADHAEAVRQRVEARHELLSQMAIDKDAAITMAKHAEAYGVEHKFITDPAALSRSLRTSRGNRTKLKREVADIRRLPTEEAAQTMRFRLEAESQRLKFRAENEAVNRQPLEQRLNQVKEARPEVLILKTADDLAKIGETLNRISFPERSRPGDPTPREIVRRLEEAIERAKERKREVPDERGETDATDAIYEDNLAAIDQADRVNAQGHPKRSDANVAIEELASPTLQFEPGERPNVEFSQKEMTQIRKWIKEWQAYFAGNKKSMPANPKFSKRKGKSKKAQAKHEQWHTLVQWAYKTALSHRQQADLLASNIVPPNSKAGKILNNAPREVVFEILKIMHESAQLMSPLTAFELRQSEQGVMRSIFRINEATRNLEVRQLDPVAAAKEFEYLMENGFASFFEGGGMYLAGAKTAAGTEDGFTFLSINPLLQSPRQVTKVLRQAILGPQDALNRLADSFQRTLHKLHVNVELTEQYIAQRIHIPMQRLAEKRLQQQKDGTLPEGVLEVPPNQVFNDISRRIFLARAEGRGKAGLTAEERYIYDNITELYKGYEPLVKLFTGKEPRDFENYITYMTETFRNPDGPIRDAKERTHIIETLNRFLKERKGDEVGPELITDVVEITRVYARSMLNWMAWKPYVERINDLGRHYGVEGGTGEFKPTIAQSKAGREPIPKGTWEYMNRVADVMQSKVGGFSAAVEKLAGTIWNHSIGKVRGQKTGREVVLGFVRAVNVGALGMNPASALRNLTDSVIGASEIGHGWWWNHGVRKMWLRREDGTFEMNPILHRLGVLEQSYVNTVGREMEITLRESGFGSDFKTVYRDFSDIMLSMFKGSEFFNRASVGLGAYAKAKKHWKDAGATPERAEAEALAYARDIVTRTQGDYSRILGGVAFSGSAGRIIGQFGRFAVHRLDWLQLMFRRAVGSEASRSSAARQAPLLPGENAWAPIFRYLAATSSLMYMGMEVIGIALDDLNPFGTVYDPAKKLVNETVEGGIEVVNAAAGGDAGTELDAKLAYRKYARGLGLKPDNPKGLLATAFQSLGPGVDMATSLATFAARRDSKSFKELGDKAGLIVPGWVQLKRFNRAYDEARRGYVVSQRTGLRIFPEKDKQLDDLALMQRMVGLQPVDFARSLTEYSEDQFKKRYVEDKISELRQEVIDRVQDGEDISESVGWYRAAIEELGDQLGQTFTAAEFRKEINHIKGRIKEATTETVKERLQRGAPFRRGLPTSSGSLTIFD